MSSAPTLAPALPMGQAAEHLRVKLRPDLIVQPQFYEGMTHYVVKDPIAPATSASRSRSLLQQLDGVEHALGRQESVRAVVPAAIDLDRGPDPIRRPVARGGNRPARYARAGLGPDLLQAEEPLEEVASSSPAGPRHQDRARRSLERTG